MEPRFDRQSTEKLIATRKAEALERLNCGSAKSFRNLGEMQTTGESIAFVNGIYALGATTVLAVDIYKYSGGENSGKLLVELPKDRFLRSEILDFEKRFAESMCLDGSPDEGQLYLFLKLD